MLSQMTRARARSLSPSAQTQVDSSCIVTLTDEDGTPISQARFCTDVVFDSQVRGFLLRECGDRFCGVEDLGQGSFGSLSPPVWCIRLCLECVCVSCVCCVRCVCGVYVYVQRVCLVCVGYVVCVVCWCMYRECVSCACCVCCVLVYVCIERVRVVYVVYWCMYVQRECVLCMLCIGVCAESVCVECVVYVVCKCCQ